MKVSLHQVVKKFDGHPVVAGVTQEIHDGEIFFLLGPSGCGKTTLLRCVAGFYLPDSGEILIGDQNVTRLPPHQRDTAMVFQSYALWPHMTARENVAFGLDVRRLPKAEVGQRVLEALRLVKMADRAEARPNQLSGGQQQRVALARALVVRPTCLLLDEPLSNLDAKLRVEMRTEIRRICREANLTAIYVTHDQKEALSVADRLAVMHEGKILQCGTPQEVHERPVNQFVAGFIGETNFLAGTVAAADARRIHIDCVPGRIVSTVIPAEPIRPGDRVTLSLRPEVIHLGPPPADAVNMFRGLVHDTVYLGEMAQHQLTLGDSAVLKVFDLHPRILARGAAPEPTPVWFRPENVLVLTR